MIRHTLCLRSHSGEYIMNSSWRFFGTTYSRRPLGRRFAAAHQNAPGKFVASVLSLSLVAAMGMGAALVSAPAASAAPITTLNVQAAVTDHKGIDRGNGSSDGNAWNNCITYQPANTSTGYGGGGTGQRYTATNFVTSGNEALTGHGQSAGCPNGNSVNKSTQSALGITPAASAAIEDGQLFNLARIAHYNNPVTSEAEFFSGNLKIKLGGFDGTPELVFPWTLWETSNSSDGCPTGRWKGDGNCQDQIKFTSQVSDQTVTRNGLNYRLVIGGFIPTTGSNCPATPTGNAVNDFWTNEKATTSACIYASIVQVRELTVHKVTAGINPPAQAFTFTSNGTLDGSVWKNGNKSVTPTSVGTPVEVFKNELLRSDKVTITEGAVSDPRWALTSMVCTQLDSNGVKQPVTGVSSNGRTITLENVQAPLDTRKPNIDCIITNTFTAGSLTISKVLEDPDNGLTLPTKNYTGSYNCGAGYSGSFTLQNGTSQTFDRIPVGSNCIVTETAPTGDLKNSSYAWGTPAFSPSNTATIGAGSNSQVTITNRIVQNKGTFSVTKKVFGPAGGFIGTDRKFPVTYSCTLAGGAALSGTLQVDKDGTATSGPIPSGYSCVLSENLTALAGDFADGSYEWLGSSGSFEPSGPITIGANGSNVKVTLSNNYERKYGQLVISKKVVGPAGAFANTDMDFKGSYTCNGVSRDFSVKAGASFTSPANTIPAGSSCVVNETAPSGGLLNASYQWSAASYAPGNATVTVPKNGSATVAITNTIVQNSGKFAVTKTVSGPANDNGYTGASTREFTVNYVCTIANGADITGTLSVTTAAAAQSPAIPAGYACLLSEPALSVLDGDFADASYEWVSPTAAAFSPGNKVTIGKDATTAVELENKYIRAYGSLQLQKKITGAGYIGEGQQFTVNYNCGPNFSGQVKLAAGDAGVTINNLPANTICTVSEETAAKSLLDAAHKWGPASWNPANAQITTIKNETVNATVTNPTVEIFGGLSVTKAVTGGGVNSSTTYSINVTCGNGYSETFTGTAGLLGTTQGLPVGTSCTVEEPALPSGSGVFVDDSYAWDTKPAAQTTTISAENQIVALTVTNKTKRVYGSLNVRKSLVDPDGVYAGAPNNGAPFSGTWSCTYGAAPAVTGTWTAAAGGLATVAGENILLGSTCSVTENAFTKAPSNDNSYSWLPAALAPNGGVVILSAQNPTATVNVTNTIMRSTGLFSLTKVVTGPTEGFPAAATFPFTWSCEMANWAGASGSFTLTNGASWDGPGAAGTVVPAGASCTVTEGAFPAANSSYTWDGVTITAAGEGANGSQSGRSFTFTVPATSAQDPKPVHITANNALSRKFGSVTVSKTVGAGYDPESGTKFTVRLDCDADGAYFTEVAGGASATIGGIPLGSECAVTEDTPAGGLIDGSYAWDTASITPGTVTIAQSETPIAVAVHNPTKRVYGELVINKELAGLAQVTDIDRFYEGGWKCVYGTDAPVTGSWKVKAGMTTSAGQPLLIGSVCEITSENTLSAPSSDPSYSWLAPVFSKPSTVTANPASLTVTNEVKRDTGSIKITKELAGEKAGLKAGETFTMIYSCAAEGVPGTLNGQVEVPVGAESVLVNDVPFGWNCHISEAAPRADQLKDVSYSWGTVSGAPEDVVVSADNNPAKLTVTNTIVRNLGAVNLVKTFAGPTGIVPNDKVYTGDFTCSYGADVIKSGKWSTTAGAPAIELAAGLPLTATCTATEDALGAPSADPSYKWAAPKFGIVSVTAGSPAVVEVTNTLVRDMGSLEVTKEVTGSDAELAGYLGGSAANFTVNYSCSVPGQSTITPITGSVTLGNGETATLADADVPFGWSCVLTEATPHQDRLADASFAWGTPVITPATVSVNADAPKASITVENPIVRVKGAVQVRKVLDGPDNGGAVAADRDYSGNWRCTYGAGSNAVEVGGDWSQKAGAAAITLSNDVLVGSDCVITEDALSAPVPNDPSYRWVSATPTNDSVELGSPAQLVMTNTFTRDSGSFTVVKRVDGAGFTGTDTDKVFTISYNCGVGYAGTITLAKDGSATIDGIPAQRSCALSEELPVGHLSPAYKWIPGTWSANVVDGAISVQRDETATATLTNHTQAVFGKISVTKELNNTGGVVQGKTFIINVVCTNDYRGNLEVAANGTAVETSNIPVGTECTISEVPPTGGLIDDSYGWAGTPAPQTVTITEENQVLPVVVTNSTERRYGSLSIAKVLEDPDKVYSGGNFTGTWVCSYNGEERTGTWSVAAGSAAVAVASDILLGSACTVTEDELPAHPSADTSYVWAPSYTPGQVVVLSTSAAHGTVTVTNTVTRLTGSFAVTKSLAGTAAAEGVAPGTKFDFDWKCTGTGWAGASGSFSLLAGTGSASPSETIPAGANCTVTELANPATTGPSYTWDGVDFTVTGSAAAHEPGERSVSFTIPAPSAGESRTVAVAASNTISQKFGDVVLSKKLAGATGGYDGEAAFTLNLTCEGLAVQSFELSAAAGHNTATASLPIGTKCSVTESAVTPGHGLADSSYSWGEVKISNGTFTVASQTTAVDVEVSNTIDRVTGSVDVTKVLTGPEGIVPAERAFTGTWSCTYQDEPAVSGKWSLTQGATSTPVTGILLTSDCVVAEDKPAAPSIDPSYRWELAAFEGATVFAADVPAHLVVTNKLVRDTGSIAVTKNVTGAVGGYTGGEQQLFDIRYSCSAEGVETPLTGTAMLANGGSVNFAGIPFGWDCLITEENPKGNLSDGSFAWEAPKVSQGSIVLDAGNPSSSVTVENAIKRVYGSVKITKLVSGPAKDLVSADREFTGDLVCTYGNDEPVTKEWKATTATPAVISGILVGSNCVVTEDAPTAAPDESDASMVWLPAVLPADVQVGAGDKPAEVTVTNPTEQLFGDFSITKTVTGARDGVDPEALYTFNWVCTPAGFASPISGSLTLAAGETWTLPSVVNVPRGSSCAVTEDAALLPDTKDSAYTWEPVGYSLTGVEGSIEGATATFTVPTDGTKVLVAAQNPLKRSYGTFEVSKSSDPASGTTVKVGQDIKYTLTARNTSEIPVHDVVLTDDLKSVLESAALVNQGKPSQGEAGIANSVLRWNVGTLAPGAEQTISYTVRVNAGSEGKTFRNVVLGAGDVPPSSCAAAVPSERSSQATAETPGAAAPCGTTHTVDNPAAPPVTPPAKPLANTGVTGLWFLGLGSLLLVGGVLTMVSSRRRNEKLL